MLAIRGAGPSSATRFQRLSRQPARHHVNLSFSNQGGAMQVLSEGQTIKHEQYGLGTVTESNHDRTTIDFDSHGVKKFVTSIWTAELVGEPPADRPARRRGRRKTSRK
jgi:predicted ATPase